MDSAIPGRAATDPDPRVIGVCRSHCLLKAGLGLVKHPGHLKAVALGVRPSMIYGKSVTFKAGTSIVGT